jgi:hypothetical protein
MSSPDPGVQQKDVVQYLAPSGLSIVRVDRRPSDDSFPFRDIYFVETTSMTNPVEHEQPQAIRSWPALVEDAVNLIKRMGGEVDLIGLW